MNITIRPIAVDGATAAKMAGVSLSTWQELVRLGKAPRPRLASPRRVVWVVEEIEDYVRRLPLADLPPPPNTGRRGVENRLDSI